MPFLHSPSNLLRLVDVQYSCSPSKAGQPSVPPPQSHQCQRAHASPLGECLALVVREDCISGPFSSVTNEEMVLGRLPPQGFIPFAQGTETLPSLPVSCAKGLICFVLDCSLTAPLQNYHIARGHTSSLREVAWKMPYLCSSLALL